MLVGIFTLVNKEDESEIIKVSAGISLVDDMSNFFSDSDNCFLKAKIASLYVIHNLMATEIT